MLTHPKTILIEHPEFPEGLTINVAHFDATTQKAWKPASKTLRLPDAKVPPTSDPEA